MIPPDVASNLRLNLNDQAAVSRQTQPLLPTQQITDALSNLVPGQRLLAEIQAILPNGAYRAIVSQREITLALPFSAKSGDSLELEVQESDGKLTLAYIANRSAPAVPEEHSESASTTLSKAGQLIGTLLDGLDPQSGHSKAVALNGNQPLMTQATGNAAEMMPVLKQAIAQSGVFYEAHQAKWVAGELPTETLRAEPQGKAPVLMANSNVAAGAQPDKSVQQDTNEATRLPTSQGLADTSSVSHGIPRELVPIVQQQLDALATQNYAWQGQIWPGQQMWWEIREHEDTARSASGEAGSQWQTRLKLELPHLGGIDITLRLQPGGNLDMLAKTTSATGESALRDGVPGLKAALEGKGLNLMKLLVRRE